MKSSITNKRYFLSYTVISFLTIYLTFSYIIYSPQYIVNEEQTLHVSQLKSHPSLTCLEPESAKEERYMTYLPHSGFHNQRNSLENAVFLSWVLNRTLIIPPIIFTKKHYIPHRPFDTLYKILNGNLTNSIMTCKTSGIRHKACRFTQLNWDELMNFKFIQENIRYIHRKDLDFDVNKLYSFLKITDPNSQVYTLAEEMRYDFQFYDDESITRVSDDQFNYLVHICSLQQRKEKLIHFGSVYHLNRFNLNFKENIEFIESVRENMIINHPVILDIGEKISEQLGGLGSYVGVHLRLGDNGLDRKFGSKAQENVDNILKVLLEEDITTSIPELDEINVSMRDFVSTKTMIEAEKCIQSISPELRDYPIIYIASDKPRNDPRLMKILKEFPCIFMLSNFEKYLGPLKKIRSPKNGALLFDHLVPLIDGIVAARGNKFIGTPESTFSDYFVRLHEHWVGA